MPRMNSFFRTDLNLKSYWWHRLFIISFIIFILIFFFQVFTSGIKSDIWYPWSSEEVFVDRLDNRFVLIQELLLPGEILLSKKHSSASNYDPTDLSSLENVYCSLNLVNFLPDFENDGYRFLDDSFYKNDEISYDEFYSKFMIEKRMIGQLNCVEVDRDNKLISTANSNYYIYSIDSSLTLLSRLACFFISILITLFTSFLLLTLYYKGLLYIIFGSAGKK